MPRKHCSTRVRSRGHVRLNKDTRQVILFGFSQRGDEWEKAIARTVSQRQAEEMEAGGEAERIHREIDGVLVLIGWRLTSPDDPTKRPPPAMLTHNTSKLVAEVNPSRMSRRDRAHYEKFLVWPLIRDHKAPLVPVRVSDADHARGEAVLAGTRCNGAKH